MIQKKINILFALVHKFLPWSEPSHTGFDNLSLLEGDDGQLYYALCCGHCLSLDEVQEWSAEGLVQPGHDRFGRDALVAGPNAKKWLNENWPSPEDERAWA
jgi:hypothetical protein